MTASKAALFKFELEELCKKHGVPPPAPAFELAEAALKECTAAMDHALELDYFSPGGSTEGWFKRAGEQAKNAIAKIQAARGQ